MIKMSHKKDITRITELHLSHRVNTGINHKNKTVHIAVSLAENGSFKLFTDYTKFDLLPANVKESISNTLDLGLSIPAKKTYQVIFLN